MNKAITLARLARTASSTVLSRAPAAKDVVFTRCLAVSAHSGRSTLSKLSSVSPKETGLLSSIQERPSTYISRALSAQSSTPTADEFEPEQDYPKDPYSWVDKEARELISKAYKRHKALADKSEAFPPSLSVKDLEKIGTPYHYAPKDFVDRLALNLMRFLRVFVHGFFREKYDHHAVCLETVAAVPGLVGSFHRHLRSLRRMRRDHGWINVLQEEAENERMHLLIFMKVCKPTALEKSLVLLAQGMYLTFYSSLYLVHSRAAHRLTGYLEEEAHRAYTDYLASIDSGKIPNRPAPSIARAYYRLPQTATMRDVILHVRADEAMHRDVNHHFGNKYGDGDVDSPPSFLNGKD